MQTFLPYEDFSRTAQCLDWRRLGKQRVETKQVLNIVSDRTETKGWRNHPAVLMWAGHDIALALYGLEICSEWKARGYVDNLTSFFSNYLIEHKTKPIRYPSWMGDTMFHSGHRQTLLFKDFEWYIQFGWTEEPKYEYYWPVQKIESK